MRKIKYMLAALACMFFLAVPGTGTALEVDVPVVDVPSVDGMVDNMLVGANGMATSVMDVVDAVLSGDDSLKVPALGKVGDWVKGLGTGVVNGVVRASLGGADVVIAPAIWVLELAGNPVGLEIDYPLSPEAVHVWFGPDTRSK